MSNEPTQNDNGYMTQEDSNRLDDLFVNKPTLPGQIERVMELKATGHALCKTICKLCPPSGERASAVSMVDTAIILAEAAIRRNEVAYAPRNRLQQP